MSLKLEIEGLTVAQAKEFILAGLQKRKEDIEAQIAMVTGSNGSSAQAPAAKTPPKTAKTPAKAHVKGQMSAEGRARIVAAQKKRWALKKKEAKAAKKVLAAGASAEALPEALPESA